MEVDELDSEGEAAGGAAADADGSDSDSDGGAWGAAGGGRPSRRKVREAWRAEDEADHPHLRRCRSKQVAAGNSLPLRTRRGAHLRIVACHRYRTRPSARRR